MKRALKILATKLFDGKYHYCDDKESYKNKEKEENKDKEESSKRHFVFHFDKDHLYLGIDYY